MPNKYPWNVVAGPIDFFYGILKFEILTYSTISIMYVHDAHIEHLNRSGKDEFSYCFIEIALVLALGLGHIIN
jgi:hypothetical protein